MKLQNLLLAIKDLFVITLMPVVFYLVMYLLTFILDLSMNISMWMPKFWQALTFATVYSFLQAFAMYVTMNVFYKLSSRRYTWGLYFVMGLIIIPMTAYNIWSFFGNEEESIFYNALHIVFMFYYVGAMIAGGLMAKTECE